MTVGRAYGNGRHTSVPVSTGLHWSGALFALTGQSASVAHAMRH
jgi:hypothetical protein